jgi:hypothetical protein
VLREVKVTVRTEMLADPLRLSAVAEIVAVPGPTPVTRPDGTTVATAGLSLDQAIGKSVRVSPVASRRTALRETASPGTSDAPAGCTVIEAVAPTRTALNEGTQVLLSGQPLALPVIRSASVPWTWIE